MSSSHRTLQGALLYIICGCALPAVLAKQPPNFDLDERGRKAIQRFIVNASKVREEVYGNVHLAIIEAIASRRSDGTNSVTEWEIEYWARENLHFRLDSKITKSSDAARVGQRERLIVTPDGYLKMFASPNKPLTIHNWGGADEGLALLRGYQFIWAAIRGYSATDIPTICRELLGEKIAGRAGEHHLIAFKPLNDYSEFEVTSRWEAPGASADSTFRCDVNMGVVLRHEATLVQNGETYSQSSAKSYDFENFRTIPARNVNAISYSKGGGSTREETTRRVDWDSVPLGIFSLEAQGFRRPDGGAVWLRRLVVFMVGVFLVLVTLAIRHRRRSADA